MFQINQLATFTMDLSINKALTQCIAHYLPNEQEEANALTKRLLYVFELHEPFMDKVGKMDEVFNDFPKYDELREVTFDLLLMNFFADDVKRLEADYLDSEEWAKIEDKTIDRGTELLNLLLYLSECKDEDIEPELDDFLREFLLVDEDEFQDEYHLYEPVIENQILVESTYSEIAKVANKVDDEQEVKPIFYVLMSYFMEPAPKAEDWKSFEQFAPNPNYDKSLYQLLINFSK